MFPSISSKHESPVVINAGESEGSAGRSSTTDGRGGPATWGYMELMLTVTVYGYFSSHSSISKIWISSVHPSP